MLQKYMPLIFGFIYLNVAALLNIYFIFSSAIRIGTQEVLFRKGLVGGAPAPPVIDATATTTKGPVADRSERALPKPKANGASGAAKAKSPTAKAVGSGTNGKNGTATNGRNGAGTRSPAAKVPAKATAKKSQASSSNGSGASQGWNQAFKQREQRITGSATVASSQVSASKEHPRSKAKRERKAR